MIKSQELGDPVLPTIIIPTRTWGAKCIAWGRWISRHTWISHTHTSTMRFLLSLLCSLFALSLPHAHTLTSAHTHPSVSFKLRSRRWSIKAAPSGGEESKAHSWSAGDKDTLRHLLTHTLVQDYHTQNTCFLGYEPSHPHLFPVLR